MNPTRTISTQCTHAEFMQTLPAACGNRPYEIVDNQEIVYNDNKRVEITVTDQPIRHLVSLALPMEKAVFQFVDYSEN